MELYAQREDLAEFLREKFVWPLDYWNPIMKEKAMNPDNDRKDRFEVMAFLVANGMQPEDALQAVFWFINQDRSRFMRSTTFRDKDALMIGATSRPGTDEYWRFWRYPVFVFNTDYVPGHRGSGQLGVRGEPSVNWKGKMTRMYTDEERGLFDFHHKS